MKYTWTCFFWEFRAVSSTVLVLIFFYHIRLIDTLLKHFLEHLLTKKIELRVEIEDLILDLLNKKCHIHGIMIYHPTIAEDPRWHYEYLCYAKSVTFTFDPLQSFYAFCKSDFSNSTTSSKSFLLIFMWKDLRIPCSMKREMHLRIKFST